MDIPAPDRSSRRPRRAAELAVAGMLTALGDLIDGRRRDADPPFEIEADTGPDEDAIELVLHPDIPAASLALVRPRLLRR